ncbi:DUF3367 domain-containing protein [Nocardioides daphniae]|uniref:DUF3367 domain-containing protein n=1 Tax=Nocardioides daphniae TaxID=402297 RepID=A0A4V1CWF2_9ACTN|nr:alpha-(1->3)-arabinofuranosyltransferase family protein [Nocardioides daphniae]QCC77057.1 DUF3367 domain-containing protein [Nocardioides daphniae]
MALSFRQRLGDTTFDTKLDLSVDASGFLDRTLTAWNPMSAFGEMQNQAYGYLFPHGAFFYAGEVVGLPEWVVQRLWSGLLLVLAYEGARRLFTVLDAPRSRPWLPMLAGLAYAFSPRFLGLSGTLTGEIHPTALLPWVVLPLVMALRGRLSPLLGAAWSGVAVLMMGGVNATEVLMALPLPGFVILCAIKERTGRRLALWWPLAVILATLWWVLALLTQGRYSPPFLNYIETAASTTAPLGWANVARGADHWLSFVWVGGRPWWPGSYELATDPWLVGVTGAVAAISVFGLFHRRMPWRLPLALSALTGILLLGMGHNDVLAGPFAVTFRELLDGVLSPFRNIHKLDPVVRLPLAMGFAHGVGVLGAWAVAMTRKPLGRSLAPYARPVVLGLSVVLLLASAQPLFLDQIRKPGWKEIPQAWYDAADYLGTHSGQGRALILPGAGFGQQTWGWTIDEPLQPLAKSPWVSRSQVPLAPGATIRYLDAIEERIQDGVGSPVLADALARAGIKHVVVRRDLDLWATEAPSPARVDQALSLSPGLEKVASYGTAAVGGQSMIDIFEVDRNVPLLEAVDIDSVKTLSGPGGHPRSHGGRPAQPRRGHRQPLRGGLDRDPRRGGRRLPAPGAPVRTPGRLGEPGDVGRGALPDQARRPRLPGRLRGRSRRGAVHRAGVGHGLLLVGLRRRPGGDPAGDGAVRRRRRRGADVLALRPVGVAHGPVAGAQLHRARAAQRDPPGRRGRPRFDRPGAQGAGRGRQPPVRARRRPGHR